MSKMGKNDDIDCGPGSDGKHNMLLFTSPVIVITVDNHQEISFIS